MNSFLAGLGTVGVAAVLTAVLWLGTNSTGKVKSLPWGACLILSLIAGAAFKAAGGPFGFVAEVINDGLNMLTQDILPGLTLPAVALIILAILLWKKLSLRGLSMVGIVWFYVVSGAGGSWGYLADRIDAIAMGLAS